MLRCTRSSATPASAAAAIHPADATAPCSAAISFPTTATAAAAIYSSAAISPATATILLPATTASHSTTAAVPAESSKAVQPYTVLRRDPRAYQKLPEQPEAQGDRQK